MPGAVGVYKVEFDFGEAVEVTKVSVKTERAVKQHVTRTRVVLAGGTPLTEVSITCYSPEERQSVAERLMARADPVTGKFNFSYSRGTRTYLVQGCLAKSLQEDSDQNGTAEDSLTFPAESRTQIR